MRNIALAIICLVIGAALMVQAEPEIVVGDVDLTSLEWGNQAATIEVTNTTGLLKFVVVQAEFNGEGLYLQSKREKSANHILPPGERVTIETPVEIPGTFGKAHLTIMMYDVVDTLDILLPGQKFYEQPFTLNFRVPEGMHSYVQQQISLPPRTELNPMFDTEFSRILLQLVSEGKSPEEIARLAECDTSYINVQLRTLARLQFFKGRDPYFLNFPFIAAEEADAGRTLAEGTASRLSQTISGNMKEYWTVLDSLIQAGAVPKDSFDFISGATFMYRPDPVVSAILLWYDLGTRFITRTMPLYVFEGTDICAATNVQYMYAVAGGEYVNGKHFYALVSKPDKTYYIMYADHQPLLNCDSYFAGSGKLPAMVSWHYRDRQFPEYFVIDTSAARPLLNHLNVGTDPILADAYKQLEAIALQHGHDKLTIGHRYWFWNLVATMTLDTLREQQVIERRGDGHFRFDALKPTTIGGAKQ